MLDRRLKLVPDIGQSFQLTNSNQNCTAPSAAFKFKIVLPRNHISKRDHTLLDYKTAF